MALAFTPGLIALTRFGYGPRGDGDVAVAGSDPRGLLRAELAQPGVALLGGPALPTTREAAQLFFADRERRRAERERVAGDAEHRRESAELVALSPAFARAEAARGPVAPDAAPSLAMRDPQKANAAGRVFRDEALARIRRGVEARTGFVERLVAFWSNHFCVSAGKGGLGRVTAGAFEREAIRPHVLGRFSDMLLAAESHPAMLHTLDNAQSVGPNSRAGAGGRRGLNENLGREILELHTLGVDGGYGQGDVTALASILTGWTFVGPQARLGEPGAFVFNPQAHEPGAIELLGTRYPEDGVGQGMAALETIARRPETARHVATKLARAFRGEAAPPALIERLARVFRDSDGDLRALSLALVDAPEAWTPAPVRMRTPYELLLGAHRLLQRLPEEPGGVLGPLNQMGMPLWTPPGPNGFPETLAAWASPEGMKLRLDWSAAFAARLREPPNPSDLLEALTGGAPSAETRDAVAHAESRQQGLALLLMSPEMQRA